MNSTPRVVCLLPARNAQADLPGFLQSAARFCDAVVALDDGSTDETAAILAASPLVKVLLRNPRRETYQGWDDQANRSQLLAAAAQLEPDWVIQIDSDERLDPGDAAALRQLVAERDRQPYAYGFRVFGMRRDLQHCSPRFLWVYRLFPYAPGQVLPQRLHLPSVPTSIPSSHWLRTTLRIQHLGGLDADRRRARFEKYQQVDPDHEFQADYSNLLRESPGPLLPWEPRSPDLPLLLDQPARADETAAADPAPALSAVIIARDDEARIARTVASVVNQECPEPFEVIVVTSGHDATANVVRTQFPTVTVVELPRPALPGVARNAGLRLARGEYVSFPGSHVELRPGSLAARLRAHRLGYAMVTGSTENGNQTLAGWASYFVDHAGNLPGQPAGVLAGVPPHCSYARAALEEVGGFPEDRRAGEDIAVNAALVWAGYTAYRDPAIRFVHASPCRTPWHLLAHHFVRGRGLGRLLVESQQANWRPDHDVERAGTALYVPQRLWQISREVIRHGADVRSQYARVFPLVLGTVTATWLGTLYELNRARLCAAAARLARRRQDRPAPNREPRHGALAASKADARGS